MPPGKLSRRADIQQRHTAAPGERVRVRQMPLLQDAMGDVLDHETGHVDRVFGGGVGRRVGQIQVLQLRGLQPRPEGGGKHVDALVHPLVSHDLGAQQAVGPSLEDHLHGHDLAAGIVARVAHRGENDAVRVQPRLFGGGLADPGDGGGQAKHLEDGAPLGAGIPAVAAADVVRRDTALLVGGTGQGEQSVLPGDEVPHLYRVAYGVNVRNGGLHPVIDHDAVSDAQLQAGASGELRVRRNADGQHHHVGVDRGSILQQHIHAAVLFRETLHKVAQRQLDAVPAHLTVEKRGHVRVEGIHQMRKALDNGDLHPQLPQVLRQLHADEAAARQHGGPGTVQVDVLLDAEGILYGAQGEQLVDADAREPRLSGLGAGGEEQLVVALLKFLPGLQICHGDRLFFRMDGSDLVAHLHADPEAGEKALRRLERQLLGIGDHASDVVWQAAVGVRDVPGPLKDHDLRLFVQPADTGRGGSAARHAAYDDNLHINALPSLYRRRCRRYF